MSIKINASYTTEEEREFILKSNKPILRNGYKFKDVKGEPYNHIYITQKKKFAPKEIN